MEDPLKIYNDVIEIASEEFREEDHPRDSDGRFTDKGGGGGGDKHTDEELQKSLDDVYKWAFEERMKIKRNEPSEWEGNARHMEDRLPPDFITNDLENPKFRAKPNPDYVTIGWNEERENDTPQARWSRLYDFDVYDTMVRAFNKKHEISKTKWINVPQRSQYSEPKRFVLEVTKAMDKTDRITYDKDGTKEKIYEPRWGYYITLHKSKRNARTSSTWISQANIDKYISKLRELEQVGDGRVTYEQLQGFKGVGGKFFDIHGMVAGEIANEIEDMRDYSDFDELDDNRQELQTVQKMLEGKEKDVRDQTAKNLGHANYDAMIQNLNLKVKLGDMDVGWNDMTDEEKESLLKEFNIKKYKGHDVIPRESN